MTSLLRLGTTLAYLAILACSLSFLSCSCCAAVSHNLNTRSEHPENNLLDQPNQVLTSNTINNKQMVEDMEDSILTMTEESSESLAPWLDRVRPRCFRQFVTLYSNSGEFSWLCSRSVSRLTS